jgi:hypothetical protein
MEQTLSWLPVDLAASSLADILFGHNSLQLVYHLENPNRQSWPDMILTLRKVLHLSEDSVIAMDDWLALITSVPDADNPAKLLADFFERDFIKMSCGSIILETVASQASSATLRDVKPVNESSIGAYIAYWRSLSLLPK